VHPEQNRPGPPSPPARARDFLLAGEVPPGTRLASHRRTGGKPVHVQVPVDEARRPLVVEAAEDPPRDREAKPPELGIERDDAWRGRWSRSVK
jgi:hypothetical protein